MHMLCTLVVIVIVIVVTIIIIIIIIMINIIIYYCYLTIPLCASPVGTPEHGEPAARGLSAPVADCGRAQCSPGESLSATALTCQQPACMQMSHVLVS